MEVGISYLKRACEMTRSNWKGRQHDFSIVCSSFLSYGLGNGALGLLTTQCSCVPYDGWVRSGIGVKAQYYESCNCVFEQINRHLTAIFYETQKSTELLTGGLYGFQAVFG